jgi:hypothetical protein
LESALVCGLGFELARELALLRHDCQPRGCRNITRAWGESSGAGAEPMH